MLRVAALTLAVGTPLAAAAPTRAQVAAARADLRALLPGGGANDRAHVLGGLVRLAFHDAGTFDVHNPATSGRADGCVDLAAPDNGGLQDIVERLAPVADAHADAMSRADVWQLAANVAIEEALPNGAEMPLILRFGRADAADATAACAGTDAGMLPDAEKSHDHTTEVFQDRLGFTQEEIVALMGAHTLGRADPDASGYDGAWVNRADVFDNQFFSDIINRPWRRQTNAAGDKHSWVEPRLGTIMLNTDMALAFDIGDSDTVNNNNCNTGGGGGRRGGPRGNNCPRTAPTANLVQTFAGDRQAWYDAFAPAWQKMGELGYTEGVLQLPDGDAEPGAPGAPESPVEPSEPPTPGTQPPAGPGGGRGGRGPRGPPVAAAANSAAPTAPEQPGLGNAGAEAAEQGQDEEESRGTGRTAVIVGGSATGLLAVAGVAFGVRRRCRR